jgi:hypothetical protein
LISSKACRLEQTIHYEVPLPFATREGRLFILGRIAKEPGVELNGDHLALLAKRGHPTGLAEHDRHRVLTVERSD